jgi:MFS family permease
MLRISFFRDARFSAASAAITLVFFALFGSIFLLTQYLQFVKGYTPLEAGFRVTPIAAVILGAPLSARLVERVGRKAVVTAGLLIVATGLATMSTVDAGTSYPFLAVSLATLGFGMGMTMAPATDSVMGSVPKEKAGVGSAMNDTTRQVGGALGVAILGSVLAQGYGASIALALAGLPPEAAGLAGDSIGGAVAVATRAGGEAGAALLRAAGDAFVDGMGVALLVAAGVAVVGALTSLRFLPAEGRRDRSRATVPTEERVPVRG